MHLPAGSGALRLRPAFTLIVLLVVVALVGLLSWILLPARAGARHAARAAKCLSNLRSIGQGVVLYQRDFNDFFPLSADGAGNVLSASAWLQSLQPYGVIPAVRLCPSDPARTDRPTSYATNDALEPLLPWIDYNPITRQPVPGGRRIAYTRVTQIPFPHATIHAVESRDGGGSGGGGGAGVVDHVHTIHWSKPADLSTAIDVARHRDTANYLCADGHATPIAWARLRDTFRPATSIFNPQTARSLP